MNIKFDYNPKRIELIDHVIREMDSIDHEDNRISNSPHIQIRCKELSKKYEGAISVSITYKNSEGKFLGLDEGSAWKNDKNPNKLISITVPVSIPTASDIAYCNISVDEKTGWFYPLSGKLAVIMLLSIVASWVLKSYGLLQ